MARFLVCIFSLCALLPLSVSAKHALSICAIFQNEAPYLKEWIEFHKLQGVEHFFLYNNKSADNYLLILNPYIERKEVTLIDWPYTYPAGNAERWLIIQSNAYTDCIKRYGKTTDWLAVIDIDEFLFCPSGELLPSFLEKYTSYGAVCANWLLFGTSNMPSIPKDHLMIEVLTQCSLLSDERNKRIKSIVQPKYVKRCRNAHAFDYNPGYFAIGSDGSIIQDINSPYLHLDQIRINHYWTRAEDDFQRRKIPSRHHRRNEENAKTLKLRANSYNLSSDTAILQFVEELRKQMELY